MDERHTHPAVEGPGSLLKLAVATLLGGASVTMAYGWLNDALNDRATPLEAALGFAAVALLIGCLAFVGKTVREGEA